MSGGVTCAGASPGPSVVAGARLDEAGAVAASWAKDVATARTMIDAATANALLDIALLVVLLGTQTVRQTARDVGPGVVLCCAGGGSGGKERCDSLRSRLPDRRHATHGRTTTGHAGAAAGGAGERHDSGLISERLSDVKSRRVTLNTPHCVLDRDVLEGDRRVIAVTCVRQDGDALPSVSFQISGPVVLKWASSCLRRFGPFLLLNKKGRERAPHWLIRPWPRSPPEALE